MDLRKCLFFDHFFSALSSKKRVLSILASLLVISLVIYLTSSATDTPSSPSLFSRFFPSGTASSVEVLERTHHRNSSKEASFSGRDSDLGETQFKNHTGDAKNSTVSVSAKPPTVVLQTQVQNSSGNGSFSGESTAPSPPTVVLQTHAENSTANGSFSGESTLPSPLGKAQEGNSSTSTTDGVGGQVLGKAHVENATKDGNLTRVFEKKDGVEGKDVGIGESATGGKNVSGGGGEGKKSSSSSSTSGGMQDGGSKNSSSDSMKKKPWLSAKCNIFNGRWVRDETKPYYPVGSCPHLDDDFNCHKNGRPDDDYLKWKWQPYDCDIPSLNATDFLSRLRGKRLLFVGDSLNRNMWESLVCILRHSIKNKKRVYEVSGKNKFKTRGYYSFKFEDYKCSVDYVRSPFLVRELYHKYANGSEDEKLRLDLLDDTSPAYRGADIIVFNTGHWWTHEKTSRGIDYYQEGNHVYPVLKVMEAYKKGLTTWARWVDKNINPSKTRVFFRGYSLTHFRGGQWNSGGQCHKETEPIFNQAFLSKYPPKMKILEGVLKQMKTPVIYLNITQLTDYRKDGHPSIYRMKYNTVEEQIAAERFQDCSHWCLPGVPDAWNELLYASLLVDGKGSWRQ